MKRITLCAVVTALIAPATAGAEVVATPDAVLNAEHPHRTKLEIRYNALYERVQDEFGEQAPGRNIVEDGIKDDVPAPNRTIALYIRTLRAILAPPRAGPPSQPRGATGAPSGDSSNPMVDPSCEAGHSQQYDPSGTYWGKYQFDRGTWVAHGGSSGSYGSAPEAEQDRVAANVTYDAWPNC